MEMSAAGIKALEEREGVCLEAYQDSRDVWTIGVGHTGSVNGVAVHRGMTITQAECDALFAADIHKFMAGISKLIKVPCNQNQADALGSFAFNIGLHGFEGSSCRARLNRGDYSGAADAMLMWEKPPELKKRRESERRQFLTPMPKAATPTTKSSATNVALAVPHTEVKQERTMNPIAIFTLAMGLAKDVAPMIPEIVGDVKTFVADMEKLIADLSKKDVNTTMADIEALFDDIKADIPTVLKAVKVAKTLPLS